MRLIGHLKTEGSARTFGDYLTSLDIRNLVEPEQDGWAIWVYAEDQIEAGRNALASYFANPDDGKFRRASQTAAALRQKEKEEGAKFARRMRTREQLWPVAGRGRLTLVLIVASVLLTVVFQFTSDNSPSHYWFFISLRRASFLPEVRHGEVWRLITPIFLHMTMSHLLFNMFALNALGSIIESREGSRKLLAMVLVLGILSNLTQYLASGPFFGGMSGVVYGLFGYAWIRGKVDPASGYFLDGLTIAIMLVWFFLCLFGFLGGVANGAHATGLVLGMLWGAAPLASANH
jgi:GlpG protein